MGPGERLRALRGALGLTQEQFAAASQKVDPAQKLTRVDVVAVEMGRNQARTHRVRSGVAAGAGTSLEDASAYLDGEIDLEELLRRKRGEASGAQPVAPRRFRDRPEWGDVVAEAKQRFASIPAACFDDVGEVVDHLDGPLDVFFVGDFARMLLDHAARHRRT